ncbi:MAG: methionyl-tRNA formyltransferase [Flavobacteriales bacterium]|nr:methionyl-tRNA formyltransferase [Flavobacteriales bacterium]
MKSLKIVFMGTPEFAVASLDALVRSEHQVVAVVTVADKPAGRGQQLSMSPVKLYAVDHHIPVLQPLKLRDESFLSDLKSYEADLFVIVAFRMLPEVVWSMPPMGSVNLHGSLLPKYRGAAPINRAIMNGEKETGVTVFLLQHEVDTGKVIRRAVIPIGENTTAGELHDDMMIQGAHVLVEAIHDMAEGNFKAIPQDELISAGEDVIHAPKIFKEDCEINWNQSCSEIHNFIRGLSPYPAAWTRIGQKTLKIFSGKKNPGNSIPDSFHTDGKSLLEFKCADGTYVVHDLQIEGKKRMKTEEFLRGWRPE